MRNNISTDKNSMQNDEKLTFQMKNNVTTANKISKQNDEKQTFQMRNNVTTAKRFPLYVIKSNKKESFK